MSVTVLSQPNCGPCTKVKGWLESKGVEYVEKDVTQDEEAYSFLMEHGLRQTPVIVTDTEYWTGINLEKMRGLVDGK